MTVRMFGLCAALMLSLASAAPAAAQTTPSKAVKTMAGILMTVQHFPTDDQKKTLTALVADPATTADEKVLAQAMIDLQHSVPAAEKTKVEAVAKDTKAPEPVRSLAEILGRFLHKASDADATTLKKLSA